MLSSPTIVRLNTVDHQQFTDGHFSDQNGLFIIEPRFYSELKVGMIILNCQLNSLEAQSRHLKARKRREKGEFRQ